MITPVWLLLASLYGCGGESDPLVLREGRCMQCGRGGDDVHAGCTDCCEMANEALNLTRPDIDKARALYSQTCEVHYPPGCHQLGLLVRDGRGGPRDMKRAADLFTIACEKGGIQEACTEVGIAAYDGQGMKKDQPRGIALFEAACSHAEQPQPKACAALGLAYLSGGGFEKDKKDEEKALEFLIKSCDMKYAGGCVQVGDLYMDEKKGGNKKENIAAAADFYNRACKLDPRNGCFELAELHATEKLEEPSFEKAAIFYQKTCNIDPTRGCYEAAELMFAGKVPAREGEVESLYNIACEHGHTEACSKRAMER